MVITTTTAAKTVSFSRIFNDKKSITIYFPSDISLTFRIVKEIHNWIPCFQSLLFVFPEFQRNFYKSLISEKRVRIVSLEELNHVGEHDLVLILSHESKIQKVAKGNDSTALFGYGKEVNVRFRPVPRDALELCKKIMELLNIPPTSYEQRVYFPSEDHEFQKEDVIEDKYIIDVHNLYTKLRAVQSIKKLPPPYEYLSIKTKYPHRKSKLIKVSSDPKSPTQYPLKVDLYEVMKHCNQAKRIITDNRPFYELLSNFSTRNRIMFCENFLATNKLKEFIK